MGNVTNKRIIPVLLLNKGGIYKGIKFKKYKYIGDPHNAIRVFNEKEVDELFLMDITATNESRLPDIEFIKRVSDECYMPFGIGGGITSLTDIRNVLKAGAEKVSINTSAIINPEFIKKASDSFGSQSIVVSIDFKSNFIGKYLVYTNSGKKRTTFDPIEIAQIMEDMGAGELLINSIDRDGTGKGLELNLLKKISSKVTIPVIGCGGIGSNDHIIEGFNVTGVSAIAAGSFFVFTGTHRSVLISYPSKLLGNNHLTIGLGE